ncbi:MAG: MBL fold metallo-hydrolase, partial [Aquificaceae bacterium]
MLFKVLSVGLLSVNCSLVVEEESGQALIIDPGADYERIVKELQGLKPVGIVATHGHIDHVGQVKPLKEAFDIPFYMHPSDTFLLNHTLWPGFERQIGANIPCPKPDIELKEGLEIKVGKETLKVLHTPGHTP